MKRFRVIELFAGVGGFRVGLERVNQALSKEAFRVFWSNQWEPGSKVQHASDVYVKHWGTKGHSNDDISLVKTSDIPNHDLLVGGFPCQDYSVARNLGDAHGILGKKGVLWWQIHRILNEKRKLRPAYLMLENVDRLLKSPAKQRGRDFALMLASLSDLGYIVEWRIINAADYGMPQRRRRIFITAYKAGTAIHNKVLGQCRPTDWVRSEGVMARAFPVISEADLFDEPIRLDGTLAELSEKFNKADPTKSLFENSGIMVGRAVYTIKTKPAYSGKRIVMRDILLDEKEIPQEYFIKRKDLEAWKYLKGAKKEQRGTKAGFKFFYNEGPIAFPEPLDKPSRTIITSEGGPSPSRFKLVVRTESGKLRRLVPVELERLNQFPDNHTAGMTDTRRAFFMGNALVVGVIERLGKALIECAQPVKGGQRARLATTLSA
jgi:DNA (cytosine-5)-methyltransferase 1